ncbi:prostate-associated microseminoprotein [Denticeps clupeoides]|uniref:prostate-associated microseminoprotein n=1 Tax=Denticeps clupeoides TaxID=299321 RepID=UPI0010A3F304|nr:prostate-associated microseminoprotein [Denticeps clupeoides]
MMKMAGLWTLVALAAGTLLWTTSCLAAPMQCHFSSQAPCVYQGRSYSMGESWMDDSCFLCTCLHPVGVGCCETAHRPVDFPAWCEVRVEAVTCKVTLVQRADPRQPCVANGNSLDPAHGSLDMNLGGWWAPPLTENR